MKTIFDQSTRDELIRRINSLDPDSSAQWGKMNIYQMTRHGIIWDEWVLGINNPRYKQGFLGLIFGKMALKSNVKDDRPIQKNMPAGRGFTVKDKTGDLELQKKTWTERIAAYAHFSNPAFIHNFFGKMTREQIGYFAYKHTDHHLRQFNA
jgi:hypothetical protein